MKRLKSSEDLDSFEKNASKDSNLNRPSSHRTTSSAGFYYKPSDGITRSKSTVVSSSSSSRYDRARSAAGDDACRERDITRLVRKRSEHDFEDFDRRKSGFDRYRDTGSSGLHRSESFAGPRREFPKGFRSDRDRSRRENGSSGSWRRFGGDDARVACKLPLRDVRSPTWSRESLGSGKAVGEGREREESRMRKSESNSKSRSPTWSRDSGSEQSKSVGCGGGGGGEKKSEELPVNSSSASEMEEGELEPEPQVDSGAEVGINVGKEISTKENGVHVGDLKESERDKEGDTDLGNTSQGKDGDKVVDGSQDLGNNLNDNSNAVCSAPENMAGNVDHQVEKIVKESGECKKGENVKDDTVEESFLLKEERNDDKKIGLGIMVDEAEAVEEVADQSKDNDVNKIMMEDGLSFRFRDKGKGIAIASTKIDASEIKSAWTDLPLRDVVDDMEGPSTRGFELFSSSPVRRVEKIEQPGLRKQKNEKLELEHLDLSLSLPHVLLPIGVKDTSAPPPGSPSRGRSMQSLSNTFCTNSDGFTASMSFSGSQSFYHNPSCSLTQNSLDFEQSVHSRPLFQGVWQSQNESSHKDVPVNQKVLMNGNGFLHDSQSLPGNVNGTSAQGITIRSLEGTSKMSNGLVRQMSIHKQADVRSPAQSIGSHEIGSNYSFEKKKTMREKSGGGLYRSGSLKEQEQLLIGGADFVETVISRIVSDPIHVMARKFHEMAGQSILCVKESIREIMVNAEKQKHLNEFKRVLQNRSDLTLEMLLKSHRAQLEILVAFRTGLPEYLQVDSNVSSLNLAEVFLNLRCRNLICQNALPVDECECKFCSKKNGFCSSCMCLVCSKFDMASKTCSWVGCDVCLHWCHVDCALGKLLIRNGHNATGSQGTEMQFHCVACSHPSEMFGFVKEVFLNFAKDWTVEVFVRELEYVERIFSKSEDVRGKRLHEIASKIIVRLANNSNLYEVCKHMMAFLTGSDSSKHDVPSVFSEKESDMEKEKEKESNGVAGPRQEAKWLRSLYSEKPSPLGTSTSLLPGLQETSTSILPSLPVERSGKFVPDIRIQRNTQKEPLLPELESFVNLKLEEAKMYQSRADDARRDAEGLKRIIIAKSEKIDEEYMQRIRKLRLAEAEEIRKQRHEEFQALERAHREYFNMKMRMEADIKDLLLKMEVTRRNLTM